MGPFSTICFRWCATSARPGAGRHALALGCRGGVSSDNSPQRGMRLSGGPCPRARGARGRGSQNRIDVLLFCGGAHEAGKGNPLRSWRRPRDGASALEHPDARDRHACPFRIALLAASFAAPSRGQEAPNGTLVVGNRGGGSVWLIDVRSGERRAEVETRAAPHEVAISSDGAVAAVTNYGGPGPGNLIQFIDVRSGSVTHEITVAGYQRLHGAAFLEADRVLALTSEQTGEILVVDVRSGDVLRRLGTGGRATHMVAPGGGWLYAANIQDGSVSRVDPTGSEETRVWPWA